MSAAVVLAVARRALVRVTGGADFAQKDLLSEIAYFHNQSNSLRASVEVSPQD